MISYVYLCYNTIQLIHARITQPNLTDPKSGTIKADIYNMK